MEDTISLALTCGYFFRLLAHEIQAALKKVTAAWTHDRITAIGDYADSLPETLESAEDLQDLVARDIYYYSDMVHYTSAVIWSNVVDDIKGRIACPTTTSHELDLDLLDRMLSMLTRENNTHELVLRNWTSKEYVRESTLQEHSNMFHLVDAVLILLR